MFYWTVFLQYGTWLNPCGKAASNRMQLFPLKCFSTTKNCSFFYNWDIQPWVSSRKGIFCMFSSVFCARSHLILIPFYQFHYYFHYKTIALSNQQLVQFCIKIFFYLACKNSPPEINLIIWESFFWNTQYKHVLRSKASNIDKATTANIIDTFIDKNVIEIRKTTSGQVS